MENSNVRASIEDFRKETEYLGCNEHQDAEIHLQGETVKRVKTFTYLGSMLAEDGERRNSPKQCRAGRETRRQCMKCCATEQMNVKIKRKVYTTLARPALVYGTERWALIKALEKKVEVAGMRMLRWIWGITKLDQIRNERIRGTTNVVEISMKIQERRLN